MTGALTGRLAPQQLVGGAIFATCLGPLAGLGILSMFQWVTGHGFSATSAGGTALLATIAVTWIFVFANFLRMGGYPAGNYENLFANWQRILADPAVSSLDKIKATFTSPELILLICSVQWVGGAFLGYSFPG